jgi:hypothetical protein
VKVAAWDMRMPLESRMMFSLKGATLPSHAASSSRSAGAAATKLLIIGMFHSLRRGCLVPEANL